MSPKSKILSLLDLTSLNDSDTPAVIDALCNNAQQPIGKAAAVCVYPQFVAQARQRLPESLGIGVATVVNFPSGDEPLDGVLAQTQQALDDGVDDVYRLQQVIRRTIGAWVSRRLRRRPMIVPVVVAT